MGQRKRTSWGDRKKVGGSGNRLKDWKDDGSIVVALHTKTGITPRLFHLVPYVGDDDNGKKVIRYFPFVCHEDPIEYANRVPPQHCPIDRAIELIADDGRIEDDDVVWEASIGKAKKDRIVTKADFCNMKTGDWQNSFKPRQQYVFGVVDIEKPEEGLKVAVEPVTLGDALMDCVNSEIDGNGEEIGDPELNPYAFKFTYDKSAKQAKDYYAAYAFRRAEITPEIREVLNNGPIDISNWIDPGNSKDLRKLFEAHFKVDPSIIDLDMIFDSVLDPESEGTERKKSRKSKKEDDDNSDESSEEDSGEEDSGEDGSDEESSTDDSNDDSEDSSNVCDTCDGEGTIGKKKVQCPDCGGTGQIASDDDDDNNDDSDQSSSEEDEEDEEDEVICETCDGNGTIGKKKVQCPDCGGTGLIKVGSTEKEPESKPEPAKKKSGSKKKKDKPPVESNTKCGGCQRMIPDDANICPFCGIEFGDDED